MTTMTIAEIIQELQREGHSVTYYVRKDGGMLIRSIDGETFSGAHGNARARAMVGTSISQAREAQLKFAMRQRGKLKKVDLPDYIKQEFTKVKKKWNKAFKAKEGKPHPAGYFSKNRIKRIYKEQGEEEAMRRIHEAENYASGIAYSKNVEHLADYIRMTADQLDSDELRNLADLIMRFAWTIREEWIYPAYQELYKLNQGVEPKQVVANVMRILRL